MFTIKAASDLTGVPVATLRAWERRYGVALPMRTDSGYRVYDDRALEEIRNMQGLIGDGWAPKQAADEVLRRRRAHVPAFDALEASHAGFPAPEDVLEAARALDEPRLAEILDLVFTRGAFEHVFDAWLVPTLHLIGQAWHRGELDIASEHMVSDAVMRRLSALYEASGNASTAPHVLCGLPRNAHHAIPALAFAVAARRAGLATLHLGANVPAEAWGKAALKPSIRAVVLSVATTSDASAASEAVATIRTVRPDVLVCVGGMTAAQVEGSPIVFGDSIPESARELAERLASAHVRK